MCVIVCIKMENIVFSPPKIGWFIYSQCCSRDGRLMESVKFSIGIGGSGQILYYLVGSLNLTNILTHTYTDPETDRHFHTDHTISLTLNGERNRFIESSDVYYEYPATSFNQTKIYKKTL